MWFVIGFCLSSGCHRMFRRFNKHHFSRQPVARNIHRLSRTSIYVRMRRKGWHTPSSPKSRRDVTSLRLSIFSVMQMTYCSLPRYQSMNICFWWLLCPQPLSFFGRYLWRCIWSSSTFLTFSYSARQNVVVSREILMALVTTWKCWLLFLFYCVCLTQLRGYIVGHSLSFTDNTKSIKSRHEIARGASQNTHTAGRSRVNRDLYIKQ